MTHKNQKRKRIMWTYLIQYAALSLSGILLNLLLSKGVSYLGIPIYLDSAGTILTTFLGGLLPGVVTGYFTNLLKYAFVDSESIYYAAINVLLAVLAEFLFRRKWFRTWKKALLSVPLFALIGGVLGSLLTLMLFGFDFANGTSGDIARWLYGQGLQNVAVCQMLGDFALDLADKLITVVLAVVVYRAVYPALKSLFSYHSWLQNPLDEETYRAAQKFHPLGLSLRTKLVLLLTLSILPIAAVTTGISYYTFYQSTLDSHEQMGIGVTHVIMSSLDPDRIDEYLEMGENAQGYPETEAALTDLLQSSENIHYVYVYQIREDGVHVVFDVDTPNMPGDDPGTVKEFEDAFLDNKAELLAGKPIGRIISNDSYGYLMSIYSPVKNSLGETVCYACVDIDMSLLMDIGYQFLARNISLFIGLAVLILAAVLWFVENGVILPINSMAVASEGYAFNSETQREESAEQIHRLGIRTRDEIENLYHAIMKTTDDSVRYIAESQEKNRIITRMQESLIMTMADLVESRDQNTGDHIKNTADYTRIIMNELRKEGHYTDQLTDEYISDVYRSALLHDIGKIRIPDAVLNKPGRLTDEEFTLMKKHTVYGGEVIEKAKRASASISYLNVAKDLATYHHEWWNGRGYPEGLKGEAIPLSARIMAVADVFDALVSRRCYKEGFSFEKSMGIIREESGTHFDPLVAGAFLSAEDQVRKVLDERRKLEND